VRDLRQVKPGPCGWNQAALSLYREVPSYKAFGEFSFCINFEVKGISLLIVGRVTDSLFVRGYSTCFQRWPLRM